MNLFRTLSRQITSINPTDETPIVTVHAATVEDVDIAVAAARKAFENPQWADLEPYLVALEEDLEEVISCFEYYAGWADKIHGQVVQGPTEKLIYTVREPIGVCGQIIPLNYLLSMAAWKLGPALACGNTVVLKPAKQTPLSALYLARLIKETGFPAGVIAFTASTATGKEVMKLAAGSLKNTTLETGGKSPLIIFDDADLGQAVNRIFVQDTIYDAFIPQFLQQVQEGGVVGDPFDENVTHGPQVSKAQYDRILDYIKQAKQEGATLLLGGEPEPGRKGYLIAPTVFADVTNDMTIYREEIFGPVVVVCKFSMEEEDIRRANDTIYGLAGAVFTENISKGHQVAGKIQAGSVLVTSSIDSDIRVPFGGYKQSGIGRELGEAGLAAYSTVKSVYVNLGLKL
ncbi:aldehyde dehydrogenase [Aspergillus granulosus]|uniref:aldehyde dehydrogenase (NAD(+)) n=1 Tax=Aspergillus granulosus TaxID=176169 RepID=A0ABR4GSY6_9EURO